jgi:hypothetical protein
MEFEELNNYKEQFINHIKGKQWSLRLIPFTKIKHGSMWIYLLGNDPSLQNGSLRLSSMLMV